MLVGILPLLKTSKHSEVLNHIILQLRSESPNEEVVKPVMCMDLDGFGKNVSTCLFKYWVTEDARELACVLAKLISTPNPNLKRRGPARYHPSLEQILLHLNQFYKWCQDNNQMSLFKYENLRYEIRQAKGKITDMDVKTKCKPLFAEFTELLPGRVNRKRKNQRLTRSGRGGGNRGRKDESSDESESEDDDEPSDEDSDDEDVKPENLPPTKRRKKVSKNVSSDDEDDD